MLPNGTYLDASGFGFRGVVDTPTAINVSTLIGVGAHFNWPITPGTGAQTFNITITVAIKDGQTGQVTQTRDFTFALNVEETPNYCNSSNLGACPWDTNKPYGDWSSGELARCKLWNNVANPCFARSIDGLTSAPSACCRYQTTNGLPCSDKVYPGSTLDLAAPPFILNGQQYTLKIEGFRAPNSNVIAPFFLSDELQNTLQFLYASIVPYCFPDANGLCGTQPPDPCAQRSCDAQGFCSLVPKPSMVGASCTPPGGAVAPPCAKYQCVADYTLGATCDLVVDSASLGLPCTPPVGSPVSDVCQEYRCLSDVASTGASCRVAPWAQPTVDQRCPIEVGAVGLDACQYKSCWNGLCVTFCAAYDEGRCPAGTGADSTGASPALCYSRGCTVANPPANLTMQTCGCRTDWPFPDDQRCPNRPPVAGLTPPIDTPQDAQCNKYACAAAGGCDVAPDLTCNQYHPWNLPADQPDYDSQCWQAACVTYAMDPANIPSDMPSTVHYGRCEGSAIAMRVSPENNQVCPPPVVNGVPVAPECYEPACVGPYCSRSWIGGTPDQHLGYCPMPTDEVTNDPRCVVPYCDVNGQCGVNQLSGVAPTAPYWIGTTGERDFTYSYSRNISGTVTQATYPPGKCSYDDWKSDQSARGQFAQPAPSHPRALPDYSPDCLYARCDTGHCAYEAFNFGNPCTPNADFCVDRSLDSQTYPDLPISPPGASCPGVIGQCVCWACGAQGTPDAGFCIQQVTQQPLEVQKPCALGQNCTNTYCGAEGQCTQPKFECTPLNVCYDAFCSSDVCATTPQPGRICGNATTNATEPTCLDHGNIVTCCGDGILDAGEQCDWGYAPNASHCNSSTCMWLIKKKGKGKAALIGGLVAGGAVLVIAGAAIAYRVFAAPAKGVEGTELTTSLLGDLNTNPTYAEGGNFWSGLYDPANGAGKDEG